MATEIADAYIALYTQMPGVKNDIADALGGADAQAGATIGGKAVGSTFMNSMSGIAKAGVIAVGSVAAAGLGTAIVKGFGRLEALDQAEAKLTGLGHSAETIDAIMSNALASVKGTAYGLDDAASVAASAVAAGIKPGADLEKTLKLVADAATIAGTDMGSMGAIFGKVAASNKVQMDVINQLHDAGVPALALLAQQMGVTAEEASAMASRGEIDFATFQAAMESGLGGSALESGATFSGALDNMMAALGRVGANLLSGIFPQIKDGFGGITDALAPLEGVAREVGTQIGNTITWLKDNNGVLIAAASAIGAIVAAVGIWKVAMLASAFATNAVTAATTIWSGVTKAAAAAQWLFNVALTANPIGIIIAAIVALVAGLIWFFTQTELGQQIWKNFTDFLASAWTWLWESVLQPVFNAIGVIFTWLWENIILPIVTGIMLYIGLWAAIFTWLWENVLSPIFAAIGAIFTWVWENIIMPIVNFIVAYVQMLGAIYTWLWENAISPAIGAIATAFSWLWDNVIKPVADFINAAIAIVGDTIHNVFNGIADFIGAAFQSVLSVVRGPINALIDLINGIIGGLNSISVDIPDWVPMVGGQTFGLSIPSIPRLAEGGIVRATRGGIVANVGEGRYDEAVIPLSPSVLASLGGGKGGGGGMNYTQNIYANGENPYEIAEIATNSMIRRQRMAT